MSVAPARPAAPATPAIEWSFNPWREAPGRAGAGAIATLALALAVASLGESWIVTLGLALAAMGAVAPAFAPSRCRLDESGAGRRGPFGWERRAWREIRRAALGRHGLLLSPYSRRHWLDPWRALVLPIPERGSAPDRDALAGWLRRHGLA